MARTKEQNAAYQKAYRDRKKTESGITIVRGVAETHGIPIEEVRDLLHASRKTPATIVDEDQPLYPKTDRESGLPRSNYYSDHAAPGGWAETIQKIDPHLAQRILDKIAPPRRMR